MAWTQYKNAMSKRRPASVLEEDRFINHVMYHAWHVSLSSSYVFGELITDESEEYEVLDSLFFVSHYAPKTTRGGFNLLKSLLQLPTVFCVTEDLVGMLERLGYIKLDISFSADFRGEPVQKYVLVSSLEAKYALYEYYSYGEYAEEEEEEEGDKYSEYEDLSPKRLGMRR